MRLRPPAVRLSFSAALAATFLLSSACGLQLSMRAQAHDEWKRQYPLASGSTLEIRNTNGRIQVTQSTGEVVEIAAERSVKAGSDEDARNALAKLEIKESVSSTHVKIESNTGGMGWQINVEKQVDYVVKVPQGVDVTLVATNGDIEVTGLTGRLHAEATNGRISGTALENGATVETTNGVVTLDFASLGDSGVTCRTTNGAISVTLPEKVKARLSAHVNNGGITASGWDMTFSEQTPRRVEASIGGGGPEVKLETTNGGIRVRPR